MCSAPGYSCPSPSSRRSSVVSHQTEELYSKRRRRSRGPHRDRVLLFLVVVVFCPLVRIQHAFLERGGRGEARRVGCVDGDVLAGLGLIPRRSLRWRISKVPKPVQTTF